MNVVGSLDASRRTTGAPSTRGEADISILTESVVEDAALDWFRTLGYDVIGGPDMPPGVGALRADYGQVVLASVLRGVVARLNPDLPAEACDDAVRRLTRPEGSTLGGAQPRLPSHGGGRRYGGVSGRGRGGPGGRRRG